MKELMIDNHQQKNEIIDILKRKKLNSSLSW